VILKGFVYPWLLARALKEAGVQREIEPFIGYIPSILTGIAMLGVSLWIEQASLVEGQALPLVVPAALMTMLTGLFWVVARKRR